MDRPQASKIPPPQGSPAYTSASGNPGAASIRRTDSHRTLRQSLSTGPRPAARSVSAPSPQSGLPLPEFSRQHAESAEATRAGGQDAWFANYGTSISRALSSPRYVQESGAVGTMVLESVMGTDNRVEIQSTLQFPYQWTCELTIFASNGTVWVGTGWLASPRLVITAGHCVYLQNQGGWASRVEVQPARNGPNIPFSFVSQTALSVSGWVEAKDSASDYGALVLPTTAAGQGIGYFGYAALSDSELSQRLVNLVGYPIDKPAGTMWGHARSLSTATADELIYENDTYGGMSGCPVIQWDGSDYRVLGIHNYGDLVGNRATRITAGVFRNIQAWVLEAAASP